MILLDLNDDCLEEIFKRLPLEAQFAVKKTCPCLQNIIWSIWRNPTLNKVVKFAEEELVDLDAVADWVDYMKRVSSFVEVLDLRHIHEDDFRFLKDWIFPKVRTLNFQPYNYISDSSTNLIARIFPALKSLKLMSNITGKYLWQLDNLTDLDLSGCEFLEARHLRTVFKYLKLRTFSLRLNRYNRKLRMGFSSITECITLEKIQVDDHYLLLVIDNLLRMPAICDITCYGCDIYDDVLLRIIADTVGNRMHTLIYYSELLIYSTQSHNFDLVKMPILRRLLIYNEEMAIGQLAVNLNELRDLQLINTRLQDTEELLKLIENNRNLEILNVSYSAPITINFLERLKFILKAGAQTRVKPLKFYCTCTEIPDQMAKADDMPTLLVILPWKTNYFGHRYSSQFECMWQSLVSRRNLN